MTLAQSLRRQATCCLVCPVKGYENLTAHHVIPLSMNGLTVTENLAVLCRDCHDDWHHLDNAVRFQPHEMHEGFLLWSDAVRRMLEWVSRMRPSREDMQQHLRIRYPFPAKIPDFKPRQSIQAPKWQTEGPQYAQMVGECAGCDATKEWRPLQIWHIRPLKNGGVDNSTNWAVLCPCCYEVAVRELGNCKLPKNLNRCQGRFGRWCRNRKKRR